LRCDAAQYKSCFVYPVTIAEKHKKKQVRGIMMASRKKEKVACA